MIPVCSDEDRKFFVNVQPSVQARTRNSRQNVNGMRPKSKQHVWSNEILAAE